MTVRAKTSGSAHEIRDREFPRLDRVPRRDCVDRKEERERLLRTIGEISGYLVVYEADIRGEKGNKRRGIYSPLTGEIKFEISCKRIAVVDRRKVRRDNRQGARGGAGKARIVFDKVDR